MRVLVENTSIEFRRIQIHRRSVLGQKSTVIPNSRIMSVTFLEGDANVSVVMVVKEVEGDISKPAPVISIFFYFVEHFGRNTVALARFWIEEDDDDPTYWPCLPVLDSKGNCVR